MSEEFFVRNIYLNQKDKLLDNNNNHVNNDSKFNKISHFKNNPKFHGKNFNVNPEKSNKFFNLNEPTSKLKNIQIRTPIQRQKISQSIRKVCFQKCLKSKYNMNQASLYIQPHKTNSKKFSITIKTSQQTIKNRKTQLFSFSNDSLMKIQSITQKCIPSNVIKINQYKQLNKQEIRITNKQKKKTKAINTCKPLQMLNTSLSFRFKQEQNQVFTPQTTKANSKIRRINSLNIRLKQSKYKKILQNQKRFQQKLQKEKQQILKLRKQINKNYAKPFNPPTSITAQSYMVYETTKINYKIQNICDNKQIQKQQKQKKFQNSYKVLASHNSWTPLQIASLTKIMTFTTAIQICEKYSLKPKQQYIKIGQFQCNISGTSAELKQGQIYTLFDLYYAMMLPSGNDASLAIALWGGQTLIKNQKDQFQLDRYQKINAQNSCKKYYYERFILEMNLMAKTIGMQKSKFANSHGLTNSQNKSCSYDLCLLCQYSMKKTLFRKVVGMKIYECQLKKVIDELQTESSPLMKKKILTKQDDFAIKQSIQSQEQFQRISKSFNSTSFMKWQNTHILLQKYPFYKGIKTGITSSAGPCLSSYLVMDNREFIIIVLNCKNLKHRFKDTQALRRWIIQKQGLNQFQQFNNNFEEQKQ